MRSYRNKRRYRRVHCNFPAQYRDLSQGIPPRGGFTKDIAEGGVRFVAHKFIPVATNLSFNVKLSTHLPPLQTTSRVVWIRKLPDGDRYEMGLEFYDISNEDKQKIRAITHPE